MLKNPDWFAQIPVCLYAVLMFVYESAVCIWALSVCYTGYICLCGRRNKSYPQDVTRHVHLVNKSFQQSSLQRFVFFKKVKINKCHFLDSSKDKVNFYPVNLPIVWHIQFWYQHYNTQLYCKCIFNFILTPECKCRHI